MKNSIKLIGLMVSLLILSACTPKVGTPEWCDMMKKKDKGDWTVNETKDYIKHCSFLSGK